MSTALPAAAETRLGRSVRPLDRVYRWGGDEFLIGIHDDLGPARQRVVEWLDSLADPAPIGFPVHASAGCACFRDQTANALYREADAAMYEAKFGGGNALVCREPVAGRAAA